MKTILGIDIGTSGTKTILVDDQGRVIAAKTIEYPMETPKPGWTQQNPQDWWAASVESIRAVLAKANVPAQDIAAIGLSGQMHGMVALDEHDQVVRPAILWNDQRTEKQCEEITEAAGGLEELLKLTNNRMLTGYTGGKLLWLRDEEPENFARMKIFCCPKDYIRFRLTGRVLTDVSEASGTGFFDTKNRVWADGLIALAGLDKAIFPKAVESTALAGCVTAKAAAETGLPEGLNVYAGGGDAVIQTTGTGLVEPGVLGVVIGTSGNVSMGMSGFHANPEGNLQMFCNNEPGLWHAFGCTLTAGGAFSWFVKTLASEDAADAAREGKNTYAYIDERVKNVPAGANGVLFAPYLTGERCPYPDPNARGIFYGLSLGTTRADMARAVMEGVTYSLKQVVELMSAEIAPQKVYLSGGGASSEVWKQMAADIFELPVYTMSAAKEGGAYGAVLVAGVGAGIWKDLKEAIGVLHEDERFYTPDPAAREAYRRGYERYCMLYPANKPLFDRED